MLTVKCVHCLRLLAPGVYRELGCACLTPAPKATKPKPKKPAVVAGKSH